VIFICFGKIVDDNRDNLDNRYNKSEGGQLKCQRKMQSEG